MGQARLFAEPSPSIRFEDLVQGLADMAASHVELELAKLPESRCR